MATLYKVEMYVVDETDECGEIPSMINTALRNTPLFSYNGGTKILDTVPFMWSDDCAMNKTVVSEGEIEAFVEETKMLNTAIEETCKGTGNAIKEMLEGYGVEANERNMTAYISQLIKESKD